MYGDRRAEALPGDNAGGVDSLFLEQLSRGVSRCQCGDVKLRHAKAPTKGERRPVACPENDTGDVDSLL